MTECGATNLSNCYAIYLLTSIIHCHVIKGVVIIGQMRMSIIQEVYLQKKLEIYLFIIYPLRTFSPICSDVDST